MPREVPRASWLGWVVLDASAASGVLRAAAKRALVKSVPLLIGRILGGRPRSWAVFCSEGVVLLRGVISLAVRKEKWVVCE